MFGPPEGEVWMKHEALQTSTYDPKNPDHFYSHILLEIVINMHFDYGFHTPDLSFAHPRSPKQDLTAVFGKNFTRWESLVCMTGPSTTNIKRQQRLSGVAERDELSDVCGSFKVAWVPVKAPTQAEQFLWIDLVYPLRAIYLPRAHIAHPRYPNSCTYSRLDFRARPKITLSSYTLVDTDVAKDSIKAQNSEDTKVLLDNIWKDIDGYRGLPCLNYGKVKEIRNGRVEGKIPKYEDLKELYRWIELRLREDVILQMAASEWGSWIEELKKYSAGRGESAQEERPGLKKLGKDVVRDTFTLGKHVAQDMAPSTWKSAQPIGQSLLDQKIQEMLVEYQRSMFALKFGAAVFQRMQIDLLALTGEKLAVNENDIYEVPKSGDKSLNAEKTLVKPGPLIIEAEKQLAKLQGIVRAANSKEEAEKRKKLEALRVQFYHLLKYAEQQKPGKLVMDTDSENKSERWFREEPIEIDTHKIWGWGFRERWTARVDVTWLASRLFLPSSHVKPEYEDAYQFIKFYRAQDIQGLECLPDDTIVNGDGPPIKHYGNNTGVIKSTMDSKSVIDLVKVLISTTGIDLKYDDHGADPNWLRHILTGIAKGVFACVPIWGPLVALGLDVLERYIDNPDAFWTEQNITGIFIGAAAVGMDRAKGPLLTMVKKARRMALEGEDRKSVYVGEGPPPKRSRIEEEEKEEYGGADKLSIREREPRVVGNVVVTQ